VHGLVLLGEPPGQRDDLGQGQLDHAARIRVRGVEHGDAAGRGARQVDLVGADAERPDREQIGGSGEHGLGDPGLGPDAEQRHAGQRGCQVAFAEGGSLLDDLQPGILERLDGVRVDVLEQQRLHRARLPDSAFIQVRRI